LKRLTTSSQIQEILADFIIIGGGTAGCTVSARLAEYGFETLLLSSGSNDTLNPLMKKKSLFNQLLHIPHFKHYLPPNPSPNLNNRIMDIIVWNTLGGNSINGGGIQRLMADDWNYFINATSDQSFHIKTMSKYYQMVENFTSTDPFSIWNIHGNNGSIKITQIYDSIFNKLWKNVANELNETFTNDLANTIDYGFSFEASSFTNGMRSCCWYIL
jgi:choline dehydrogenase-like flavoprotein